MKVDKTKNNCEFATEVLSYVYDELPGAERDSFDDHLADCTNCIDELAELSYSFYSVHEWRQLDFDPLPTPAFSIPVEEANPSLLERIRAVLLPTPARLAFAGASGAVVITGLIGFNLIGSSGPEVAGIPQDVPAVENISSSPAPPEQDRISNNAADRDVSVAVIEPTSAERFQRTERGRVANKSARPAARKESVAEPRQASVQAASATPRLSDYEDSPDDSLRLADLLDEADARD